MQPTSSRAREAQYTLSDIVKIVSLDKVHEDARRTITEAVIEDGAAGSRYKRLDVKQAGLALGNHYHVGLMECFTLEDGSPFELLLEDVRDQRRARGTLQDCVVLMKEHIAHTFIPHKTGSVLRCFTSGTYVDENAMREHANLMQNTFAYPLDPKTF